MVDDNHHMRAMICEILRAVGVNKIYEANDGAEGLEQMRAHEIDIVMTDLTMQPLDGLDFVRLIRNSPDSPNDMIPVIMITGHSTLKKVAEARDAGITEMLTKPLTARGVVDRINRVVNHPRAFVRTNDYYGPDRRRRNDPDYTGPKRRSSDPPAPKAPPTADALEI